MRWLVFGFLAILTICVQTTLAPALAVWGVRADFVFILLLHYALHAPQREGFVAGWLLGLLVDLTTVGPLGVYAFVYSLVALGIGTVGELTFRRHPLTHFTLTLLFYGAVQVVMRGYFWMEAGLHGSVLSVVLDSLASAVYTGVWAIVVHRILLRYERGLGLSDQRRGWVG